MSITLKHIPNDIKLAMARYFCHRQQERETSTFEAKQQIIFSWGYSAELGKKKVYFWDKTADLDAILTLAKKHGLGFTTLAGTFWFYKKTKAGSNILIECNEENYLDDGIRTIGASKNVMDNFLKKG
jgi:hypothetical protein